MEIAFRCTQLTAPSLAGLAARGHHERVRVSRVADVRHCGRLYNLKSPLCSKSGVRGPFESTGLQDSGVWCFRHQSNADSASVLSALLLVLLPIITVISIITMLLEKPAFPLLTKNILVKIWQELPLQNATKSLQWVHQLHHNAQAA